jgi:hypothetical protein
MYKCEHCNVFKPDSEFVIIDQHTGVGKCRSCLQDSQPKPKKVLTSAEKEQLLEKTRLKEEEFQRKHNPLYKQWKEYNDSKKLSRGSQ